VSALPEEHPAAQGRLRLFATLRTCRWRRTPHPSATLFAECLLWRSRHGTRGGRLCRLHLDSGRSRRGLKNGPTAAVGRLPSSRRLAQSGDWKTRRSPRGSSLGLNR